jgi:hypothetical protein
MDFNDFSKSILRVSVTLIVKCAPKFSQSARPFGSQQFDWTCLLIGHTTDELQELCYGIYAQEP